jgi:hypothetical protein
VGRFFRRGKSRVSFGLDCEGTSADGWAPTRAQLDAAQDLSIDLADLSGFSLENSPIPTVNLAESFTPQIEGEDTTADSSLTFHDRDDAEVIRAALEKGTAGFIFLFPYGDVPTQRMEVWEVKVTGTNDVWSLGNESARFRSTFAPQSVPTQDAEVPAAA